MAPNNKQIILNKEQEAAAYCTENAVVAAGAGSGKTAVLASRYVWLVTEQKYRVREILTLTFTKKAAAQMYRRIHQMLSDTARDDMARENAGEKGKLARQALDEFAQARIQTLDSYSAGIVKQAANRYGISPDFVIDEDRCFKLATDEALPFLIANRSHPALGRLFSRKGPVSVANGMLASTLFNFTHIDLEPDFKRDFTSQCAIMCREWKRQSDFISEKLDELAEVYRGNEKFHQDLGPLLTCYGSDIAFPSAEELSGYFSELVDVPHRAVIEWAESHQLQKTLTIILAFLVSINGLDMRKGSPRHNPAKDILYELRDVFGEFSSILVFCLQAGLICSVLALLSDLQRRYLSRKRAEGIMTFSDVARLAKTILLEQYDIRQGEKESFSAIMIDEFQDNNELQKDLLYLLAEDTKIANNSGPPAMPTALPLAQDLCPGKLFFVGDEKQSIYRFRGADVSVFRKLRQELGSGELPLKTNYRSSPLLIGAFNAIFGGYEFDPEGNDPLDDICYPAVFAPDLPELPPYEASFRPLVAYKKDKGKLSLCILDKQDSDELAADEADRLTPVENEARYVAERIRALIDEGQYRPDDIAILFRSRGPQRLFEKHLMLLGVPYASEDLNGFFYGSPVNDLMSVLRLAAYPMDRAAYAQMLRSPFAGLSLPGLAICLAATGEAQPPQPFGDEPILLLTEADRAKYLHGQRVYRNILGKACTDSVSALVTELWYGEGYRYETEWNPRTAPYRELHDYLFHLAARADEENQGLATFTDFILGMDRPGERLSDIEIPMERPGAVRLMTIHKSKGLEFPVVFLCCCDKKGRNDFSDDIFDTGESGLTLNPPLPPEFDRAKEVRRNYFWERSLAEEKGKRTAELRRLLYVGMTRAENELYLSGCLGVSKFLGIDDAPDGDFSLNLKQYVEQKAEKSAKNSGINGDSILEGNTFFGLCLNALAAHIPGEGPGLQPSFFSIEKIPIYDEQYLRNAEQVGSRFANDQRGLNSFFGIAKPFYEKAVTIETPVVPKRHLSPTALSPQAGGMPTKDFAVSGEHSGDDAADVFGRVDPIIDRYAKQFDYRSFGTLAHLCVEALLAGREEAIPPQMAGPLSPSDAEALLGAGKELAQRFARSPLGIIAREAQKRHSEFRFRSLIQGGESEVFFINGTIDLVFEDVEAVYVVDFKTDSGEFPGEHLAQMACYCRAARDLFAGPAKKGVRAWLYYLRSGHAVEVTRQVGDLILEKLGIYYKV